MYSHLLPRGGDILETILVSVINYFIINILYLKMSVCVRVLAWNVLNQLNAIQSFLVWNIQHKCGSTI